MSSPRFLDRVWWGLDNGNVVGARRFGAHVGAVPIVYLAFATLLAMVQRYEGSFGTMKLSPFAKKLRELIKEKESDPTCTETFSRWLRASPSFREWLCTAPES